MLDVDGQTISADALVKRVKELLQSIGDADATSSFPLAQRPNEAGHQQLDAPVHAMRVIHREIHPPDLVQGVGLRGRLAAIAKRGVRKLTNWYVEPRWVLQTQFDAENVEFASMVFNSVVQIKAEIEEMRRQNTRIKLQVVAANERVSRYQSEVQRTLESVATQAELQPLAAEVAALVARLGAIGASGAGIDYVGFEDRFRGDSEALEESQERYVSLFPPPGEPGRIVDIGCGRGEMLELLQRTGHEVLGVDIDAGMVQVCNDKGLPAVLGNGIQFLSQTPPESLKGIFCAQVVEHLITPELEQLMTLAHERLRLGGVLVVETINPRSSFALGNHFYADTSHVRPVHPETLRFICEQVGFSRVELEERSPHPYLELSQNLPTDDTGQAVGALLENVFGFQDYVIVATK